MKTLSKRIAHGIRLGLPRPQAAQLARLKTPARIQDFIAAIPANFEPDGDTCLSVTQVLRQRRAHCIEAAFTAACALWINGRPPLLMDFQARSDHDHVVAIFRENGCWGAISKSNHVWLRWRDPVYRSLRELAMSYFHEYVGTKNRSSLWAYSVPFDLRRFDSHLWITAKQPCWDVACALDETRHYPLVTRVQALKLRPSDPIELRAGKLTQFRKAHK